MSIALLFPGQGSQSAGFLHRLPSHAVVQQTLAEASALLGEDVLMLDSEAALASTVSTQMALLVAGAAFARLCRAEAVPPVAVAGMSVGAFAAVRRRAELMEAAFEAGSHGMLVVDGLRLSSLKLLIQGSVVVANFNSATQFVLAGSIADLTPLAQGAADAGAHTVKLLRMSVASHTPELLPAAQQLYEFASQMAISAPRIAMYSNRSARPLRTADAVRDELALNMAYPVRWHDTMAALGGLGVMLLIEAPPGHTLTRLASVTLPETRWDVVVRAARRA
jgi:malonate decarboxylase epsilon subunit